MNAPTDSAPNDHSGGSPPLPKPRFMVLDAANVATLDVLIHAIVTTCGLTLTHDQVANAMLCLVARVTKGWAEFCATGQALDLVTQIANSIGRHTGGGEVDAEFEDDDVHESSLHLGYLASHTRLGDFEAFIARTRMMLDSPRGAVGDALGLAPLSSYLLAFEGERIMAEVGAPPAAVADTDAPKSPAPSTSTNVAGRWVERDWDAPSNFVVQAVAVADAQTGG